MLRGCGGGADYNIPNMIPKQYHDNDNNVQFGNAAEETKFMLPATVRSPCGRVVLHYCSKVPHFRPNYGQLLQRLNMEALKQSKGVMCVKISATVKDRNRFGTIPN